VHFGSQDVNGQFVRIREVQTKVEEDMSCAGDNAEIIDYSEHQRSGPHIKYIECCSHNILVTL